MCKCGSRSDVGNVFSMSEVSTAVFAKMSEAKQDVQEKL